MKLFVSWGTSQPGIRILFDELHEHDHKVLYWVGEHAGKQNTPPGAVFHDHYDAWDGKRAEEFVDVQIPPASVSLIERHYELESVVLTMMNKRYDKASVEERKQTYYDMLAYWHFVLEKLHPEAIIFAAVPHSVYDFILYSLARERGLSTLMFEDSWVAGRLVWFRDYKEGSPAFAEALERNRHASIGLQDIDPDLQTYYRSQTGESQIQPAYMIMQKQSGGGWSLSRHRISVAIRALRKGSLPKLFVSFVRKSFGRDLRSEYAEVVRAPDYQKPFVYFPLGFQPERTTCPQGDIFQNFILVAQTLSMALPEGWEIYIKEHPSQWWLRTKSAYSSVRYPGYYRRLSGIPRVRLVPIHTDSHTLIAHSKTVATITGTAGWEALFRRKKPLIFGYPWYANTPQLRRVRSVEDCKRVFKEIQREPETNQEDLFRTLKSLEEGSVRAHLGEMRDHLGRLSADIESSFAESMRVAARAVIKELDFFQKDRRHA